MEHKNIKIEKELLISLYWGNNYSSRNIGKLFGCYHTTILHYMDRYNIPRRFRHSQKHSEETKKRIGDVQRGKPKPPLQGRTIPDKTKKKMSEAHKGEKNYNFNNWSSREPYGKEWSHELRKQIRITDNYTCQECEMTEEELGYRLSVHHIDFDKQNNDLENLICLCKSCHTKTNFNRENWIEYYRLRRFGVE